MNNLIDKAVERYCYLEEEDEKKADEFKKKCQKYITFYNFLIQIYPIKNLNLLRLQVYLVALLKKLPKKSKQNLARYLRVVRRVKLRIARLSSRCVYRHIGARATLTVP